MIVKALKYSSPFRKASQLLLLLSVFILTSCGCDCKEQQEALQAYADSLAMIPAQFEPIDLPAESTYKPKANAVVAIDSDEQHYLNGTKVDAEELANELTKYFESKNSNEPYSKQIVQLNVDKTVQSGLVVEVMAIAKKHNWQIVIATAPKK